MATYVTRAELASLSLLSSVFTDVLEADQDLHIQAASAKADSYLRAQYGLPLPAGSWGLDLKKAVADIAAWEILKRRGIEPDSEAHQAFERAAKEAVAWLRDVGSGKAALALETTDATPDHEEGGPEVITSELREW